MNARRVLERLVFAAAPFIVLLTTIVVSVRNDVFAIDFHTVAPEIRGLAHGTNPYVTDGITEGGHFLWPILAGLFLLPLAWLPHSLGDVVATAAQVLSLLGALRLLDVRDWRIYGLVIAWPATVNSVETANLTLPICLLLALSWHDRERWRGGLWAGLAVAVKFLAWPVLVWLAATRRWQALRIAIGVQVVGLLLTLPYLSLSDYVSFERTVGRVFGPDSLTLTSLLEDAGVDHGVAVAVCVIVGLAVLALGRTDLGICTVAALLLSPVAWLHYFDLLLVPLALWRPRLWVWALPLLLVVTPGHGNGRMWQTAATLAVAAATVVFGRRFPSERAAVSSGAVSSLAGA